MKAVYALAAVALLLAPAASARQLKQASSDITDADILNFALNLECLEAQFYTCATSGSPLSDALTGGGPAPIGCQATNFSDPTIRRIAESIASDERNHVNLLRTALGNASVQCPQVDIGPAFTAAANAVAGTTLSPAFSPYLNDLFFLHGAFIFEDLGVTAYHGAAPLIQSSDILSVAAGILAVEAYHAGGIRTLLLLQQDVMTPYGLTVGQLIDAIAAIRQTLDGSTTTDDVGIFDYNLNGTLLADADMNSVAFARTPAQVLSVAYLSGDASTVGGFFPNGVNGVIGN